MSRKNEIDELFRNALSDKGMDFAPEYWEQMEALIAKRRKKVFKRAAWFSAVSLLIVTTLFLAIPLEKGSEEWAFGQGGEPVDEGTRGRGDLGTRRLGDEETAGLGDEADRPFAELVEVNGRGDEDTTPADEAPAARSGERAFGQSWGAEGVEGESRPQVRHADRVRRSTRDETEQNDAQNPNPITHNPPSHSEAIDNSSIIEKTGEGTSQSSVPNLQPVPLGNRLQVTEPKSTALSVENPKKLLRRIPSYTQWYLGSYFNYGWIKHRYDPSIQTWKTTNEKVRPFIQYGLNMRASKRGFSLSIGTGIRQWTERTRYTREIDHYTFDSSFRLINRNFIKRPDGTYAALVQTQIDTTSHTTTTEFICQDCPVTFRYITVPVAIHYEYGRGKWLGFTEAGMTFSFLSKSSGEYSVEWQNEYGKTPGMLTDQLSGTYLSSMVMQAGLTLGIKYRIHPFLSIKGHIAYQRSLSSMMTRYRQETDFYGLGLGLEWKLF